MASLVRSVDLNRSTANRKLIAWVFIITGIISGIFWWKSRGTKDETKDSHTGWIQPLKISYTLNANTPSTVNALTQNFIAEIRKDLEDNKGMYGIYVYRINDKIGYGINEEIVFPAASIMKVPIMVGVYQAINSGDIETSENIDTLMTAMGKRSDNGAPVTLTNLTGRPIMKQALLDLGMKNSNFDENTTTPRDVSGMWLKLYNSEIVTSAQRDKMWTDMQDSIFEERIPAGVPDEVEVVHKVGSDLSIWADSGIVLTSNPFVIVILNKEVDLLQAKEFVPNLARRIYEFETSLTK